MAKEAEEIFQETNLDQTISATILETDGKKKLTKRFHAEGCEQYSRVKYFQHNEKTLGGFDDVASMLRELEKQPRKMIVMGSVKSEFKQQETILRRSNSKTDQPATIEDKGSHLLHFDVDDYERPNNLSWDNPEELARWTWEQVCNRLPSLKMTSVFWQASSSAGVPGKDHLAKFHFWMLADRPLYTHERKFLFETVGSDKQLASIAQPNYTASPIFDGVADPLEGKSRSGVLSGNKEFLATSLIAFPSKPKKKLGKTRKTKSSQDKALLSKQTQGAGDTTAKGYKILNAACERILKKGAGNTRIFNEAQAMGGHVAAGDIALDDALQQLCAAASETGYERFSVAVKNGLETGLGRPFSKGLKAEAEQPFFPASNLDRKQAISLHAKTIEEWGRQTKAWLSKTKKEMKRQGIEKPPRVLLSGAQGIGKTAALVGREGQSGFLHSTQGLVSVMLLPDHKKVPEALEDYNSNASTGAPPAIRLLGRDRTDPDIDDQSTKMCRAFPAAKQLAAHGVSVRANLCKKCPFNDVCGYLKQEKEIERHLKTNAGLVIFATHEFAYLPLPADAEPDLIVFDERPRDFAVEESHVSLGDLAEYLIPPSKASRSGGEPRNLEIGESFFAQEKAIQPVKDALFKVARIHPQSLSLEALRAEGVSSKLLSRAIESLKDFRSQNVRREVWKTLGGNERDAVPSDLASLSSRLTSLPANAARRLQFLFECLLPEVDGPHEFSASAFKSGADRDNTNRDPGFSAVRVRKLKHGLQIPFLHLDGTADHHLARVAFGDDLECHHYPVERNAHVTQVIGCNFAKRRLVEDSANWGRLTGKLKSENLALKGYLESVLDRYPEAAVFSNKSIIQSLSISDASRTGHYGALRGRNRWEGHNTVIVVGREQPSPQDVDIKARAYAAAAGDGFSSGEYRKVPRGIRLKKGAKSIEVFVHTDPWGDRILRQIREAEIEQAIDRIRLIHNQKQKSVFLLSPVVVDVTVDSIKKWGDFKKGGTRIERAIQEHGVLFLSPTDCARDMPDIWKSRQLASLDLKHASRMSKLPCKCILHGEFDEECPLALKFRLTTDAGKSGPVKKALVFTDFTEALRTIERLAGAKPIISSGP
ncbi:hypothetical protein CSC82_04870 [Rhodobacteraceae bacterium 4F10]|nr:hypothetical protein CSC82_04870 [Rhodobacteraceae bacterium 4F10]